MVSLAAAKLIAASFVCITLAGGCIGTGVLFGFYLDAIARNPEETDSIFGASLVGFALIESFVFMGIGFALIVYFL